MLQQIFTLSFMTAFLAAAVRLAESICFRPCDQHAHAWCNKFFI